MTFNSCSSVYLRSVLFLLVRLFFWKLILSSLCLQQRWSRLPFAFAMTDSGGVTGPNLAAALSPQGPEQGGNSKSKEENVWQ